MNGNQEEVSRRCEAEKFGEELRRWCCLQLQSGVHRRTKAKVDLRQEGEQSSGSRFPFNPRPRFNCSEIKFI